MVQPYLVCLSKLNIKFHSTSKENDKAKIADSMHAHLAALVNLNKNRSNYSERRDYQLYTRLKDLSGKEPPKGRKKKRIDKTMFIMEVNKLFKNRIEGCFSTVPHDVQKNMLSFLNLVELARFSLVSLGASAIASNEFLWKPFCMEIGMEINPRRQRQSAKSLFVESQDQFFCRIANELGYTPKAPMRCVLQGLKEEPMQHNLSGFASRKRKIVFFSKEPLYPLHPYFAGIWKKFVYLKDIFVAKGALRALPPGLEHTNITFLSCCKNNLKAIPELPLQTLTNLNLAANSLLLAPFSLFRGAAIEELNLSRNPGIQLEILPIAPQIANRLQFLKITACALTSLPREIWSLGLRALECGENPISQLDGDISQATSLKSLEMDGCALTKVPDALWHLPKIEFINFRSNKITAISRNPDEAPKLDYLILMDNPISDETKAILEQVVRRVKVIL